MKQEVPEFQEGAILRAKTLQTLRDYPYLVEKLSKKNHSKGIVSGMELSSSQGFLQVDTGLFLLDKQIFYLNSPWKIACEPTTAQISLKLRLSQVKTIKNAQEYEFDLLLEDTPCGEHEFELCRFQLQEGARLRDKYQDFQDISTEYDTINLEYAHYSAYAVPSLHPLVLQSFAQEMLETSGVSPVDQCFCLQILSRFETIQFHALVAYLQSKGEAVPSHGQQAYQSLLTILLRAKETKPSETTSKLSTRPQILID